MLGSNGWCFLSLWICFDVLSNLVIRGFPYLLTLLIYLLLHLVISSLTVDTLRSRCIASLVTYQGASIRNLSVFDWKR